MSNYNSLKSTIDANIKQNGNQEITGQILNSVLNAMVTTLGTGYQFAGVATIATNPGTPDAKVFYIANGKGTYEKFGGLEVTEDDVVVLYWDSAWHKVATGIASQEKLSELESVIGVSTFGKIVDIEQTINLETPSATGYFDLRNLTSFEDGTSYKIRLVLGESITSPSKGLRCQTRNASNVVVQTLLDEMRTFTKGEVVEIPWVKQENETRLYLFSGGWSVNGDYEISHIAEIKGDGLIQDVEAINKILQGGEEVKEIIDFDQISTSSSYIDITNLSTFVVGQTYKIKVTALEAKSRVRVITRDTSNQNVQILANNVPFAVGETKEYEWTHQSEEVRLFVDAVGNFASHVEISHTEQVVTLPVVERLDALERGKNGFAHISFDDVVYCLNDITINASTYTSIFENAFFALLKNLHETYGAKFSLFVFLSDATTGEYATNWTLANTTTKFKNEFAKNASWLKFGLHMSTKNGNYGSASAATALDDYSSFVSSVMNFASIDNIDRLPRLANFAGSLDAVKAMRDADMGIVGALTAYDSRDSYYLTSEESSMSYKRGQIYDATNHLMYFTSLKALETISPESIFADKNTIANNLRFFNLEWMMHEYAIGGQNYGYSSYDFATMAARLETACKISVSNGYSFAYPMDIALKAGL